MINNLVKALFKQRNIDLTPEELQLLDEIEQRTGVKVSVKENSSDLSQNLKVINELKESFEMQLSEMNKQLAELRSERDAYKNEIDNLSKIIGEERTIREQTLQSIKEKQEKELNDKIEALIKDAVTSKRIAAQDEKTIEVIKKTAKTSYDDAKAIIDAMKPIVENTNNKNTNAVEQSKSSTIDYKIAGAASPNILKYVEEQFAKVDAQQASVN